MFFDVVQTLDEGALELRYAAGRGADGVEVPDHAAWKPQWGQQ